jgi:hypothetical protein
MSKNYLDSVSAAFSEAKAWKMTTFVLGVVAVILSFQLVNQARNRPVVLVPYHAASDMGRVEVTTSGELRGTSSEYVANLAMADLGHILTFNPDSAITSTKRFLNRTTEQLYQSQEQVLLARAADNKQRGVTQSFFPGKVSVSTDRTKAEVTGRLVTSVGGKETQSITITYVLTYDASKGYPHVASITQKNASKDK